MDRVLPVAAVLVSIYRMNRTTIIFITVAAWSAGCAYAAYHYVTTILALPNLSPGYEQDWQFQMLMFSIVRLPFWVLALIAAIALEVRILKGQG